MQFAILVATMIAIFLGSFLSLTYTHQFFNIHSQFFLKTISAANNGVEYGLKPQNTFVDSTILNVEHIPTSVKKSFWGGFEIIESTAVSKSNTFTKMALAGSVSPASNSVLYITENKAPLSLVGDSKIGGTVYLSESGIEAGRIAGHYFNGNNLVNGRIKSSEPELPALNRKWLQITEELLHNTPFNEDIIIHQKETNTNSFFKKRKVLYEKNSIVLNEKYFGNIIIKCDEKIIVSATSKLKDVIIIAPKIVIESGFTGNATFIASDQILVENDVLLSFPSSLILIDSKNSDIQQPFQKVYPVVISDGAHVNGTIVYSTFGDVADRTKIAISIKPDATVDGGIYCSGNIELSGLVIGSVYTHGFIVKEAGFTYVNYIFNGKIRAKASNPNFCGLPFSNTQKNLVKWLY